MEAKVLPAGKIPPDLLERIVFRRSGARRSELLVSPAIGEDSAVLDLGGELVVVTTDPITGAEKNAGWLGVKVALNDIAATGAVPVCVILTILLPENSPESLLAEIMDDVDRACREENVVVAGGHSEVTPGLSRPVINVTALGKTSGGRTLLTAGARPGDDLVVTKWAGLEGTAVLASDFADVLQGVLEPERLRFSQNLISKISVTMEGRIAAEFGAHAAHDATEGGVLGAVYELAVASNTGVTIEADSVPVLEETRRVCEFCRIDPLKLISSGCLVVASPDGTVLCEELQKVGINAKVVGKITSGGREMLRSGRVIPLEPPGTDELWRARSYLEQLR